MLTKKQINQIEKETDVTVSEKDGIYTLHVGNPCDEDFSFEVEKTKDKTDVEEIISYCDNFDGEEHAAMWYGQNRGEPSSLRALLDNSDAIQEQLDALARILND